MTENIPVKQTVEGVHEENKCIFVFNNTQISFNPKGLTQAIDKVLELYPES